MSYNFVTLISKPSIIKVGRFGLFFKEDLEEHMNAPEEPTETETEAEKKTIRRSRKRTTTE